MLCCFYFTLHAYSSTLSYFHISMNSKRATLCCPAEAKGVYGCDLCLEKNLFEFYKAEQVEINKLSLTQRLFYCMCVNVGENYRPSLPSTLSSVIAEIVFVLCMTEK